MVKVSSNRPPDRVRLFEQALARQRERETGRVVPAVQDRGWTREELYDRGRARDTNVRAVNPFV